MNMKKTIAAIAAGAVAVSAMATSVSALESKTLTYNLVKDVTTWPWTNGSATFEFTINAAAQAYPTTFRLSNDDGQGNAYFGTKSMTIKVASNAAGEQNKIYTYSTDNTALNYNPNVNWNGTFTFANELANYQGDLTITVTVEGENYGKDIAAFNAAIVNGDIAATADAGDVTPVTLKGFQDGKSTETHILKPFKTSISNNVDIIDYLEGNGYRNVGAVLNDAVKNYDSVTFTFNTAADKIGYIISDATSDKVYTDGYWNGCNAEGSYADAVLAAGGNADNLIAIYTDKNGATDKFMAFGQHLYTNYYIPEATDYTGYDWAGVNLFAGALVVNEYLTMSLAETDYFDWTQTTLSFDWDAIMDGAMTDNDYATYIQTIKLATANTWYWNSLDVVLTAGEADDATSDAGVEGDDETLDDEGDDADETIDADDEGDEAPADEAPADETPAVPEATNPTTGNASVALAVIPVALAAAAVVAKKRG